MTTMTIISAANFLPINKVNQQESLAQLAAEEYFPEGAPVRRLKYRQVKVLSR